MNKAHRFNGPPVMHGLLKRIEDDVDMSELLTRQPTMRRA